MRQKTKCKKKKSSNLKKNSSDIPYGLTMKAKYLFTQLSIWKKVASWLWKFDTLHNPLLALSQDHYTKTTCLNWGQTAMLYEVQAISAVNSEQREFQTFKFSKVWCQLSTLYEKVGNPNSFDLCSGMSGEIFKIFGDFYFQ